MLDTMPRKPFYPSAPEDLPPWVVELPHSELLLEQLEDAPAPGAEWHVNVQLPAETMQAVEDGQLDPALLLAGLRFAAGRIDDKTAELVKLCRKHGRSWTQIGEILGVSKQSAWERYSDED